MMNNLTPHNRGPIATIWEILRVAVALMRVPRLFASLFLFPLLVSFILVIAQATVTASLLNVVDTYDSPSNRVKMQNREGEFVRAKLLGSSGHLPPITVCRWETPSRDAALAPAALAEQPPSSPSGCSLGRYDVVLRVDNPANFDATPYRDRLTGKFLKLHLCRSCRSDIIITPTTNPVKAHLFSVWGLILLSIARRSEQAELIASMPDADPLSSGAKLGKEILNLPGLYAPTPLSEINATIIGILNIASLIIIGAWLAMKSHRKVLDYFAASGSLLPLVAASGRSVFYGSLWVLTGARVACFLMSSVPFSYSVFTSMGTKHTKTFAFGGDGAAFGLWLIAMTAMFSLAGTIASISELRTKYSPLSFVYRYIPFFLCVVGGSVWGMTLLFDSSSAVTTRDLIAAFPLVGIVPVLLAPIFVPSDNVLVVQSILSVTALVFAIRANTKWFGAHLEEL
jgi:hypothetical protein